MNKERIAIITEGDVREIEVLDNIKSIFFKSENIDVIPFPAGENIYMLWKQLKEDDFQTDIIEVVREQNEAAAKIIENYMRDDFAEVYLFFDYDGHQNNLSGSDEDVDVISQMLEVFNNETENGLLYVNYPMVEAFRDYIEGDCATMSECYIQLDDIPDYKNISSKNPAHNKVSAYSIADWGHVIDSFARRLSCLAHREEVFEYEEYKRFVTPIWIYLQQKELISEEMVFVLCAFPEFLLDYHKENFWRKMVKHRKNGIGKCGHR